MIAFFTPEEEQQIVAAIRDAEAGTDAEIRVHLEVTSRTDIMAEARRVFIKLGMHKTRQRNGVLLLLVPEQRKFAIIGDKGIDQHVGADFWHQEKAVLEAHFKRGAFCDGVVAAIAEIGKHLQTYFPRTTPKEQDNQLSDEISYGE